MEFPPLNQISECFIKPKYEAQQSKQPYYLSPMDLIFLSMHYNQKGLLFAKPNNNNPLFITKLLETLKHSLALTLVHFYPLAGQLDTLIDKEQHRCLVFVDCNKGPGVRFVHATLDMTISDINTPTVPSVVRSFFDYSHGEVNIEGLKRPLLSIQVTELVDGFFIGCSMNHVLVDGTSFWHFWNLWSEIHKETVHISSPPIHQRWIPDGYTTKDLYFHSSNPEEFIQMRFEPPPFQERFFHFSSETIAKLKSIANVEIRNSNSKVIISSFQALASFIWKSIIQAKGLNPNQQTYCKLAANKRTILNPPLPQEYFGNLLGVLTSTTTVSELLEHNLGCVASMLNQSIVSQTNKDVHDFVHSWFKSPFVFAIEKMFKEGVESTVQVGSSPRFNIYGNEFAGLGKPIAVRSGFANKFDGKVIVYPGCEGGGSVDAEICLSTAHMKALESNKEFMAAVSSPYI